jgi:hypothetical protein
MYLLTVVVVVKLRDAAVVIEVWVMKAATLLGWDYIPKTYLLFSNTAKVGVKYGTAKSFFVDI